MKDNFCSLIMEGTEVFCEYLRSILWDGSRYSFRMQKKEREIMARKTTDQEGRRSSYGSSYGDSYYQQSSRYQGGSGRGSGTGTAGGRRSSSSQYGSGTTQRPGSGSSQYGSGTARRTGSSSQYGSSTARRTGNSSSRYDGERSSSQRRGSSSSGVQPQYAAKQDRKRRRRRYFLLLLLFVLLVGACIGGLCYLGRDGDSASPFSTISESLGIKAADPAPDISVSLDSLDSPYAIMIDAQTGTVIGSKKGEEVIYPASMTKVLTVLVAIEQIGNLDQTINMSYDYYETLYAQDASRAGFEPGEEAKIRDLLYGALLPSGAECCMELAIQAAGSESAFAELMNQKVQELGLTQTHFTNCTGLHDDNQYTTPHEMAKILQEALNNATFREVFTTHYYTVDPTSVHPEGFTFWSSMFKNMQADMVIGGEIKGGKTGYTNAAGYCLASMAEIEGREYIQVTAGWAQNPRVTLYHINDAFLGYNVVGRALSELKEAE